MRSRGAAWLAAPVWLGVTGFLVFDIIDGFSHTHGAGDVAISVVFGVFVLAFSSVGTLLAVKRPGNPIGWLLLGAALGYTLGGIGVSVTVRPGAARFSLDILLLWVSASWAWTSAIACALVTLLLFPNGRLLSRRWRLVLWLGVGATAAEVVGSSFGPRLINGTRVPNPFWAGSALGPAISALQVALPLVLLAAVLALASIVVRFRRARETEREQIKWLFYVVVLVGVGLVVQLPLSAFMSPEAATNAQNAISTGTLALVPIAIGVAVLRYRLYDIDRIINRSLVYVLLTVVLGGVYAGLAVGFGALAGSTNSVVIAGSTLVVAALFSPARRRIQAFIDRRFYRRRYDATRTLEAFTARLRDDVDLDELREHLLAVVGETMQPARAMLWLRPGEGSA